MITRINEAKTLLKRISCNCNCKFNNTTCNSNQKWNNETCPCECKNYCTRKKDYSQNPTTFICDNGKYLKCIADTSVIVCGEIINATDGVSKIVTNTIPTNATSTVSINSDEFIGSKSLCLKIVCICKIHIKGINIKNRVYN